jgi:hypothetical protein
MKDSPHAVIARGEVLMRDKSSSYWRGPSASKIQAEVRAGYEARETGRELPSISARELEKRELEETLYSNRPLWNRTPELAARYREIIQQEIDEGAQQ